jgi:prolyl oligopeptidase
MDLASHFASTFRGILRPMRRLTSMALVLALSWTSFSADGPAAQADSAPDVPAEARQSPPPADNHAVLPEDLKAPDSGDYRIVPGDLLWLSADQLPAGITETTARVTETGNIALPRIDAPLHLAGMTDEEIRTAVQHAYGKANIHTATVEAVVTEAQGRAFLILGDGVAVNRYAVVSSAMRLLDALALGRPGRIDGMLARVVRHDDRGHAARTIDVPLDRLIAGEAGTNISIRPHDTVMILDPRTAGADAAALAAASTTQPSAAAPDVIMPEDLEADQPTDYRVVVSDLLKVEIHDLTGPGAIDTITRRVTETGNIHSPYLAAPVHVAGLTEMGISYLLVKAYRDQNIIQRALVEVSVEEARGRAFVVLGAARTNGQLAVAGADFRLLDALVLAGGAQPRATTARIIREGNPTERARVLDVPLDKLFAGEAGTNIRVRPGDAVVLLDTAAASMIQPGSTGDTIEPEDLVADKPADYQIVPGDLLNIQISDLTGPGTMTESTQRVTETGNMHLPYVPTPVHVVGLTETGIRDLVRKTYVDENIIQNEMVAVVVEEACGRRFGVLGAQTNGQFSIVDAPTFRLLNALALAGGLQSGATTARVIRRGDATQRARVLDVPIDKLLAGEPGTNIRVQPGDTVVCLDTAATSATEPSPAVRDAIEPQDLVADQPTDYRVGVCDLVKFELRGLTGPDAVTELSSRVSETGNVLLPYLAAPVHVAGLTEFGVRDLLIRTYHDRLQMRLGVSVLVTEARGKTFLVLGAARTPGQLTIVVTTGFRLLDALALAGGPQPGANVARVIRNPDPTQPARVIDVPIDKLLAGDPGMNIRVRPGDIVVLLQTFAADLSSLASMQYPPAPRGDAVDVFHGVKVPDPYRWLENTRSSETRAWADAENRLTASFVAGPVRDRIESELSRVWYFPQYKLPHNEGDHYFFEKNNGLGDQDVVYRLDELGGEPTVVLDPNRRSANGTVALKTQAYSFNGKFLAYGVAVNGSDRQEIHVRDIDSGKDLSDVVRWTQYTSIAWKSDNSGFYYNRFPQPGTVSADDEKNFCKIYLHRLGTPQEQDDLVLERADDKTLQLSPQVTGDGKYLVVNIRKQTTDGNCIYYRAVDGAGEFVKLIDKADAFYSFIDNIGTTFYFLTNLDAPRWRLIAIDLTQPARENWKTVVRESPDEIMSVSTVNKQFDISYLHDAFNTVKIYELNGSFVRDLPLPRYGSVELGTSGPEDTELFLSYSSFVVPSMQYRYDFTTRKLEVYHKPEFKQDLSEYETTEVFVPSTDGTRVPMFLTYRKGMKVDATHPVLMYGYGGFGVNTTPRFYFEVPPFLWLERGGIYAEAIIRGGAEYGEAWHQAAILKNKQHSFDDFEACARWLSDRKYTTPSRLAIIGGSNGGLLTAACMLQTPELFGAVVCEFPVTDMLRYKKFAAGTAWLPEYGDADESTEMFNALRAYSPLQNVKAGVSCPPVLVTTADDDDRVDPSHARKFVAALQAAQSGLPPQAKHNPILLRIDAHAGHLGGNTASRASDICTFLWHVFGMN